MKNKKGMTILEVIVCIMLVSIIIVFLLNLLITVKNYSTQNDNATDLLINQAVIIKAVEKDMNDYHLVGVSTCNTSDFVTTGRARIVPSDANNVYCLKLTYDNNLVEVNTGYILQYTYRYDNDTVKNVVGYKRGTNQTVRESNIVMDPSNNPGLVTTSCQTAGDVNCSLKITLPVIDEIGTNYDIEFTYIYKRADMTYSRGSAFGFDIE